jgi:3-hydroxymyristoyl/3-hydroxydecanoyl-(acyl carrier protein) dehydratase
MWHSSEVHFASDHPTAAGHFPSNPIIPGALLLDEVIRAVARNNHKTILRAAKFFRPVHPGESVRIQWQTQESGGIKFECRLVEGDALAVSGTVAFEPVPG